MTQACLLFIFIIILMLLFIYFFYPNLFQSKHMNKTCAMSIKERDQILANIAKGCTHRIRGIIRESMINQNEIKDFLDDGIFRLVIITNIIPEDLVNKIYSNNNKSMNDINLVAIASNSINNRKIYVVINIQNGQLEPINVPTDDFSQAYNAAQNNIKQLGNTTENLVFFIDEDIPCPDHDKMINYTPI